LKLLLTSAGITNPSIRAALLELLGKPIEDSSALLISTALYPLRHGRRMAWDFLAGEEPRTPMAELGWASIGVLELTALPSLPRAVWVPEVEAAAVLLVNGGDTIYLDRWMRESGLAELLPSLDLVYVGLSAGSLVMAPSVDDVFASWTPAAGGEGLGFVDVEIFPHLDHPDLPDNTMAHAEDWASRLTRPGYAIDDATAITVLDGALDVISEGQWRRFEAGGAAGSAPVDDYGTPAARNGRIPGETGV
jgi:dipeptidase E